MNKLESKEVYTLNDTDEMIQYICSNNDSSYRYALLSYMYSKCDQDFINKIYSILKKKHEIVKERHNIEILNIEYLKRITLNNIYDFLYNSDDSINYALYTYAFTEIVYPIVTELDKLSISSIFNSIKNNYTIFILPIIHIINILIAKQIEKNRNYKHDELVRIANDDNFFKGVKVIGDLIKPFRGIKDNELHIVHISNAQKYTNITKSLPTKIKTDKNNGEKFRLLSYRNNEEIGDTYLWVDSCTYVDVMNFVDLYNHKDKNYKLYDLFKTQSDNVCKGLSYTKNSIQFIPPNSLCLHMIVLTSDGYVLFTKKDSHSKYYPNVYDFSIEEQLSRLDFDEDGVRIDLWASRALKEELGVYDISAGKKDYMSIKIQSVVREDKYLNFALMALVNLKITKNKLESILNSWPRQDYEFEYEFIKVKKLYDLILKNDDFIVASHPTAPFRLYLLLKERGKDKKAETIRNKINNTNKQ